jgi:hypothetical protein
MAQTQTLKKQINKIHILPPFEKKKDAILFEKKYIHFYENIFYMVTIITFIWNHNINTFCKICLNLKWSDSVELYFFWMEEHLIIRA